jgi:hypothetical protein
VAVGIGIAFIGDDVYPPEHAASAMAIANPDNVANMCFKSGCLRKVRSVRVDDDYRPSVKKL